MRYKVHMYFCCQSSNGLKSCLFGTKSQFSSWIILLGTILHIWKETGMWSCMGVSHGESLVILNQTGLMPALWKVCTTNWGKLLEKQHPSKHCGTHKVHSFGNIPKSQSSMVSYIRKNFVAVIKTRSSMSVTKEQKKMHSTQVCCLLVP